MNKIEPFGRLFKIIRGGHFEVVFKSQGLFWGRFSSSKWKLFRRPSRDILSWIPSRPGFISLFSEINVGNSTVLLNNCANQSYLNFIMPLTVLHTMPLKKTLFILHMKFVLKSLLWTLLFLAMISQLIIPLSLVLSLFHYH